MAETIYVWIWLFFAFLIVHPWALILFYLTVGFCAWHFIYETFYKARKNAALQTKQAELTDEEIYQIWLNYGCGMPWTSNTKTFIRAILRKASEK